MTTILILQKVYGNLKDEIINNADVTNNNNAPSFKYKANLIGDTENNGTKNGVKIAVPLKYLSNFWRSLEMPLINCKIHLELNWSKDCVMSTIFDTTFKIKIVALSSKDDTKLVKLLESGFNRPVYWNEI